MPSEYSDVSTSSCRSGSESDELNGTQINNNNNVANVKPDTNASTDSLIDGGTVSIVVSASTPATSSKSDKEDVNKTHVNAGKNDNNIADNGEFLSKEARMARVHRVASELLSTEEYYVTVLYLIDQVIKY